MASARDRICEAAIAVASRDGLLSMTLDNVAKEAGVSKGGVMYHFHTKEELVTATLEYFGNKVEQMFLRRVAEDPEPGNRWSRAMLSFLFPKEGDPLPEELSFAPEMVDSFMLSALAAAVNNPKDFKPLRDLGIRLRERLLQEDSNGMQPVLTWLVVDGLFLWRFIGMIDRNDPLYAKIGEALRASALRPSETEETSRKPRRRRTARNIP